MSSVDVKGVLEGYVKNNVLSITPDIAAQFGPAIGTAITELFSGHISLGEGFLLYADPNSDSATISGAGSAAPLLSGFNVTAVFSDASGDVDGVALTFNATVTSGITLSQAWPALLNEYPFTDLVLTSGGMAVTVQPGDSTYKLKLTGTITLEGESVSPKALLELQNVDGALGFLGGAVVQGTWTPFAHIPVLSTLSFPGELGVFFSTMTETDLSDFSAFPYMPDQVTAGLTVFSQIAMKGSIAKIAKFTNSSYLDLIAIIPLQGGFSAATVSATMINNTTTGSFLMKELALTWTSTSADSGSISLQVDALINIPASATINNQAESVEIGGQGTFTYGTSESLTLTLFLQGATDAGWVNPFGIPNLTIKRLEFDLSLTVSDDPAAEGITILLGGTIDVGSGGDVVELTAGGAFDDFEVPTFLYASLSAPDKTKMVTLANLLDAFLPELDATAFPLLNNISFADLTFYACAAPQLFEGKTYQPGIGITGDIDFYGYDLDFAFSLTTVPKVAVQAKGSLSYNGGPIVITGAGITWITFGGAGGAKFPSACIDTTAGGYCTCSPAVTDAYFCVEGSLSILGLASVSVVAAASKELFELDVDLSAGSNTFTDKLHIYLDLGNSVFAASNDFNFSPPPITIPGFGVIPPIHIPTPQIYCCLALGTVMPANAPCADGWMPPSAPYFHFDLKFSWGALDFDLEIDIDVQAVATAFADFGKFLIDWLESTFNAKAILGWILKEAKLIAKALIQLGKDIEEVAELIVKQLGILFEDAYNFASEAWDELQKLCGVSTGNDAMSAASATMVDSIVSPITPVPSVLAELASAPRGGGLLMHYYLHRDEADRLMRTNVTVIEASRKQIEAHCASREYQRGAHLPLIIDLISTTAAAATPDFRASAAEVVAMLEPYREKTYEQLLLQLHAT